MKDLPEIPTARREYSPAPKSKPVKSKRGWGWLLGVILGVGLGGGGGLIWLTQHTTIPAAQAVPPLDPAPVDNSSGTELLAHHAYPEAPREDLVPVSEGTGKVVLMRRAAAAKFKQMQTAARQAGVLIVPISGFRDYKYQENLFNRNVVRLGGVMEARKVSAPPGYSEHHTGYALDLGDGKAPATAVKSSFEGTAAARWLKKNAARFGFELSFERGNAQSVMYEPWHWRFVGDKASLETFYGQTAFNKS